MQRDTRAEHGTPTLLTFPDASGMALSIRAKALVFSDPESAKLLQHVERIARSDASALFVGEIGTGKELLARHMHERSGRVGPFLTVNCGAFSDGLGEAELFGYEIGAFAGANTARAGWFEAAHGGTLYLDEIGDLPPALQTRLLRVLQDRQVVRIGSRKPLPVDVRVIAASNVGLEQAVAARNFRVDLFYCLNVAPVDVPPLHRRRGDILPLAAHFLELYRTRLRRERLSLSVEAQQALAGYAWPGNIRELENVIHYAVISCEGRTIRANHLRFCHLQTPASPRAPASGHASADQSPLDVLRAGLMRLLEARQPHAYEAVERAVIETAFAHSGNNQVKTAKLLGISRNTVRTQLRRYGLLGAEEASAQASEE
jgi:sigma-54-specific transcriptional regulator